MFHVKQIRTFCSKILDMTKFGQRIKELREEKGISRAQLANALFVSVRLVSYWENGKRECDFETLIKLADYLGESVDYILGRVDY